MTNVLLTSVGRRVELVRRFQAAYRRLGIQGNVVATDVDWLAPALQVVDRPYLVPRFNHADFIPTLAEICAKEEVSLVLPLIDPEIPVLAAGRTALEATGARLGVVSDRAARIASDKWETYRFFRQVDIPTPRSCLASDWRDSSLNYPVVVKPRTGSAGHGIHRVEDAVELSRLANSLNHHLIQERVDGPEVTVDVVCDLDGELLASVPRQRIAVRGGEAIKSVTIDDDQVLDYCATIAKLLPAAGPITIQCMMNGSQPFFIEINARLGGGVPLSSGRRGRHSGHSLESGRRPTHPSLDGEPVRQRRVHDSL